VTSDRPVALVTGANKGIGYEIAAGLCRLGFVVGVGARDATRRGGAVARLQDAGYDPFGVALDVTDDSSVAEAFAEVAGHCGRLDGLVINAGITGGWQQEPTRVAPETVRAAVETNDIGVIRATNAFLPLSAGAAHRQHLQHGGFSHLANRLGRGRMAVGRLRPLEDDA
jgi:NAD(P)-dependent dehydrogenase (short-subunit alcohol dehydrogenase family)